MIVMVIMTIQFVVCSVHWLVPGSIMFDTGAGL